MGAAGHDTNLLAGYLEGRLTKTEEARLISHLAACPGCRETLATYARAAAAGQAAPPALTPARVRWSHARVWLPVAALLALSTGAAVTVLRLTDVADRRAAPAAPAAAGDQPLERSPGPADPEPMTPETATQPRPSPEARGPALSTRRSAERRAAGKTFRLVAGEWVDSEYDPLNLLPIVEVATPDDRAAVFVRAPALREYAAVGSRVLVVHQGTVYRFTSAHR